MAYLNGLTRIGVGGPAVQYPGFAASASAAITGTALDALESDIVSGGRTIIITLTADTWVASGPTFNAQRQNIINGVTSAQSELTGWNNEVRDKEVVTSVVRTSDTVVTITLTASPAYKITADEIITVTVPATALTGGVELTGAPTISISYVEVTEEEYTGGWSALNYYQAYLQRRRERERRQKQILSEVRSLDGIDREIGTLLQKDLEREERDKEISTLESLVKKTNINRERALLNDVSMSLGKAYTRAYMQGSFSALEAFERELLTAEENEEFLLLAMLL